MGALQLITSQLWPLMLAITAECGSSSDQRTARANRKVSDTNFHLLLFALQYRFHLLLLLNRIICKRESCTIVYAPTEITLYANDSKGFIKNMFALFKI